MERLATVDWKGEKPTTESWGRRRFDESYLLPNSKNHLLLLTLIGAFPAFVVLMDRSTYGQSMGSDPSQSLPTSIFAEQCMKMTG